MKPNSARLGYTLVEILVVAVIIALLTGAGLAAYGRFDRVRKIEQSALNFAMFLREQQKKADNGMRPSSCILPVSGYQVEAQNEQNQALSWADCGGSPDIEFRKLMAGVFADDDDGLSVKFLTVGQGVEIETEELGQIEITDTPVSVRYEITVTRGGAITVEKI